jgi:hypothetical protein
VWAHIRASEERPTHGGNLAPQPRTRGRLDSQEIAKTNVKRVARIRREEGIKVSKKQRRMKRLGISTAERQQAERARPNVELGLRG